MKVVERVFEKRFCRIVSVDEMQFGLMPERGAIDAEFILRKVPKVLKEKGYIYDMWTHKKLLTEYQGKCWNGQ